MPPKRKRGRPPFPDGTAKESRLVCRISKAEDEEIAMAAKRAKLTKSDFVRRAVLLAARAAKPRGKG